MAWRQKKTPNLAVPAQRGWCLKYIDDAGGATKRLPSAQAAYQAEKNAGRIRTGTIPTGVWFVGFLAFTRGPYVGLGHVFFIKNKGNGVYDIRDSEVRAGARSAYTNINQVISWFGAYAPKYTGYSTRCDGVVYAESYTPTATRIAKKGTATVLVSALNVRSAPKVASTNIVAVYKKGEKFNYDSYIKTNGYTWLSYISRTGKRRYVAQASGTTRLVSGGV